LEHFVVTPKAHNHIVQRLIQRFLGGDARRRPEAEELVVRVVAALKAQTPDDWRFTRHPSAHFFISVVQECCVPGAAVAKDRQVKLLGGTYRMSGHGAELEKRLRKYVLVMTSVNEDADAPGHLDRLEHMADLYLADLQEPASAIVHELKTAYAPGSEIAQRRASSQKLLEDYCHTAILRSLKVPRLHAALPNALLCADDGSPSGFQVWVRQAECWTAPRLGGGKPSVRALFCPLTKDGPTVETGQIWSFDAQGNIKREGQASVRAILGVKCPKPEGYRSESYWVLPTRLDAIWLDHDYLCRERAYEMSAAEVATLTVVRWIYELALAKAGLGDGPAWYRKGRPG